MKTKALKRTFLRAHRYGMLRQLAEKQQFGTRRNYRSAEGRTTVAENMVYRKRYA